MATARRQRERGFTALEALVTVAIFTVVMLFAVTTFQGTHRMTRSATMQGDSQQSARLAVDILTKDLRALGYGVDLGLGQQCLVHASPYDVIFNANVTPVEENPTAPGFPLAMDPNQYPATVPAGGALYTPTVDFGTGAETIRYTLDSSGDGVIDAGDVGDDPEEATSNPRDYVLRKEVYGAAADNTNGGESVSVGLVRGPDADADGTLPQPLFTYWIDDDDDPFTAEVLHGDVDGDGVLSQSEIAAIGDVPASDLALVTRVIVTVTAEDGESSGRGGYRTRKLVSSVSFRNQIRRAGVITGTVFQDNDGDGVFDWHDEPPIPGTVVRLDTGTEFRTNEHGRYHFEVSPGIYSVTELDPAGYVSTTPNVATVDVLTGTTQTVDFGDRPGLGIGTIRAFVYSDDNLNGAPDGGERGLENVIVTLNTGLRDTTDANGNASFNVPVGAYTVVETDSSGWTSTTPNVVEVVLATEGDVGLVQFGDVVGGASGRIAGTVFLDDDQDGEFDVGETGIADVPIILSSGDSTVTNGDGGFSFTVAPGSYGIREYDLEGYSSSTPNNVLVTVAPDSTVEVFFGDLYDTSVNFTVVTVGTTDRALSIAAVDLGEDIKNDPDIILGTETAGTSNLHVWHNQRKNANTAIVSLFTATPTFSRNAGHAVQSMLATDLNADGHPDAITGLATNVTSNLLTWITQAVIPNEGVFGLTPAYSYQTGSATTVLALERVSSPTGGSAVVVGAGGATGGRAEIYLVATNGSFGRQATSDLLLDGDGALGDVTAIASGDFDGDGRPDLAIGQDEGNYAGRVSIFLAHELLPWTWYPATTLETWGSVLALEAVDMKEDNAGDLDLIVGTSMGASSGRVQLWHNDGRARFGDSGLPSDYVDAGGEVLAIGTTLLDPDVFPDVIAGLRTGPYAGALRVYRGTGFLPSDGTQISIPGSGEVSTLTIDDFNIDGLKDVAAGTRTAFSTGELVIYFGTTGGSL